MSHLAMWAGLGMNRFHAASLEIPGVRITRLTPEPPGALETREAYIRRMAALIPADVDFIGGFSLGGMLALEQAALFPQCKGILLLSYAADRTQWRTCLRLAAAVGLMHVLLRIPAPALQHLAVSSMRLFGSDTYRMMRPSLTRWSPAELRTMLRWLLQAPHVTPSVPCLQIIGRRDPWLRPTGNAVPLEGAGHFFFPKYRHAVGKQAAAWINVLV